VAWLAACIGFVDRDAENKKQKRTDSWFLIGFWFHGRYWASFGTHGYAVVAGVWLRGWNWPTNDLETKKGWGEREAGEWEWGREGQGGESSKQDDGESSKQDDGESSKQDDGESSKQDDADDDHTAVYAVYTVSEEGRRRAGDDQRQQKEGSGCPCDK